MSREIKFRRAYFTDDSCRDFSHFSMWGVGIDTEVFRSPANNNFTESFVDQQFVGLRDDNGVDIYEGDILETLAGRLAIEWNDDVCTFQYSNGSSFYERYGCWNVVVGNICEHPELLAAASESAKR